jgi:phosphate transport system substrate-binding protein
MCLNKGKTHMLKKMTLAIASMVLATNVYAQDITGAGATFPYPVYSKWADEYKKATGKQVNYQSIGSGAGIKQIQAKTVTFGASDMPLDQKTLDKDQLVQFPTVVGGNVLVYNLDGIKDLVLSGELIANRYLGKITKWNDAAIKVLNPNVNLPNTSISVVRRSDGSGTTYIFAKYLSSVSDEWKTKVGMGTALEWPVGVGARGNEGVAGNVSQTRNSIGYVEYAYAKQNKLSYSSLQIGTKNVREGIPSFQTRDWPIADPTYIIMHKNPNDPAASKATLEFFSWAFANGDATAEALDYVPISDEDVARIKNTIWNQIKF